MVPAAGGIVTAEQHTELIGWLKGLLVVNLALGLVVVMLACAIAVVVMWRG